MGCSCFYASLIKKKFEELNYNVEFKEKFKNDQFKILMNPLDEKYVALVFVDKGTIIVEKILKKTEKNISKETLGWDGSITTSRVLFNDISSGKKKPVSLVLKRKLKVQNPKVIAKLSIIQSLIKK